MDSTTIFATILIHASRFEALETLFKKLGNKIRKGKTHADFAPSIELVKSVYMVTDKGKTRPYNPDQEYSDKAEFQPHHWVTIKYQRPVLSGWQLVAVYDWEYAGDTVTCYCSPVPGMMVPPEYREVAGGQCDHCNTNRRRNKSMLLTNETYSEWKVVGTTCIKDFLGHLSPKSLMDVYSFQCEIDRLCDPSFGGGAALADIPVDSVLTVATMLTDTLGFVRAGDWDKTPTATDAWNYMNPTHQSHYDFIRQYPITDDHRAKAKKVAEWVLEQSTASDYMANLVKAVSAGAITHKRFNLVVSAVSSYNRAMEREVQNNTSNDTNEFLGNVKDRLRGIVATVKRVRHSEGYYGITTIITLKTGSGDTLVWFATGDVDVELNDMWKLDGTVKKHDTFNGINQTVLTRVKFQPLHSAQQNVA